MIVSRATEFAMARLIDRHGLLAPHWGLSTPLLAT
jgi:hypothetical protein